MAVKKTAEKQIDVIQVRQSEVEFCLLGMSPIILNRMSEKVKHELLMPKGKRTAADKAASLKHEPYAEFRASAYRIADPKSPTLLGHPATAFKSALRGAAVDIPGSAAKAQIGRLTYVLGEFGDYVPLYGLPKLHMAVTRNSDINKTPDIRTRVIVPRWAARVVVRFIAPVLKEQVVANLMAAAGMIQGTGDWRPEKGQGDFGQWELVTKDDERFLAVIKEGGRKAQEAAMETPDPYDAETAEMLTWFDAEANRRGFAVVR